MASPPPGLGGAGRRKSEWFTSPPLCKWSNWAQDILQGGPPCFLPLCVPFLLTRSSSSSRAGRGGRQVVLNKSTGVTEQGMARRCLSAWPSGSRCSVPLELHWLQWLPLWGGGDGGGRLRHPLILLICFLLSFTLSQVTVEHSDSDRLLPLTLNTAGRNPQPPRDPGLCIQCITLQVAVGAWSIPWSPAVKARLGCAFFTRLEAPGLGVGLSSVSYSQMPQDLASSLRYCHFWPLLPGPFTALYLSRILGLRSRTGHDSLFEMERKKKQREKAQHLHVSLHVTSHKAARSEC